MACNPLEHLSQENLQVTVPSQMACLPGVNVVVGEMVVVVVPAGVVTGPEGVDEVIGGVGLVVGRGGALFMQ